MDLTLILPLILLAVLMVFMWRSNKKRTQQQQEMRSNLRPGAEVMTQSGIYGTIVDLDEENHVATIESSPGTLLRVHSSTIANIVPTAEDVPVADVPDDASALDAEAQALRSERDASDEPASDEADTDESAEQATDAPSDDTTSNDGPNKA